MTLLPLKWFYESTHQELERRVDNESDLLQWEVGDICPISGIMKIPDIELWWDFKHGKWAGFRWKTFSEVYADRYQMLDQFGMKMMKLFVTVMVGWAGEGRYLNVFITGLHGGAITLRHSRCTKHLRIPPCSQNWKVIKTNKGFLLKSVWLIRDEGSYANKS